MFSEFTSSNIIYLEVMSDNEKVKKERKKMIILKSCFFGFLIAFCLIIILVFIIALFLGDALG